MMSNLFTTKLYKCLAFSVYLVLIGCSSDDDSPPPDPMTSPTETMPVTGASTDEMPVDDGTVLPTPQLLTSETTIEGRLGEFESQIYQIDSDVDISLISDSGDVDLILYDNIEDIDTENPYNNDKILCGSGWWSKEDVCTASAADGTLYAHVLARSDSDYRINATAECSVQTINRWVDRSMRDFYLYSDQVSDVNPDSYDDPAELVRDLRFEELDPFSGIRDAAAQSSFFEEGIAFGFGWGGGLDSNDNVRVSYVHDESSFGQAGIKRGDIVVSIEGETFLEMTEQRYFELIGTQDNPLETSWQFIDGETGENYSALVKQGDYRVNSVLHSAVYANSESSGVVGYLVLKQFIEPTSDELDDVIAEFVSQGVTELVLDLRYNGGGRVRVATRLAEQIAGAKVAGQLEMTEKHNQKYAAFDFSEDFSSSEPSLNLDRLIVLTTDATASASERTISSLRPYMDVVTIGSATRGKPFASWGRTYCGKTLNAMQTEAVNAADVSVAGGISADCFASDDMLNDFGPNEGMFRTALDYVSNGSCLTQPQIASRSASKSIDEIHLRSNETRVFDNMSEGSVSE